MLALAHDIAECHLLELAPEFAAEKKNCVNFFGSLVGSFFLSLPGNAVRKRVIWEKGVNSAFSDRTVQRCGNALEIDLNEFGFVNSSL